MCETSKPEAWQRGVHIGLHHDIHFLRSAQRRVFADVPVRLGMQIANKAKTNFAACGHLGEYTAKPNLPGRRDSARNFFLN